MKYLLATLSFVLFVNHLTAQPSIEWEKSFGGSFSETTMKIINTPDQGYLVGSSTESLNGDVIGNHGSSDVWLTKIDQNGAIQWKKCLGGLNFDGIASIENTHSGGYVLVGNTSSNGLKSNSQVYGNRGGQDIWVVKVDGNGEIEWRQCYGGCDREDARSIRPTSDGNFVVVGGTQSFNTGEVYGVHGDWDAWALKISSEGAFIWQKTIGGSSVDYLYDVVERSNGNLTMAGLSSSSNGDLSGNTNKGVEDTWVLELSAAGDLLWSKTYGGSDYDGARSLCLATDGNLMVTGLSYSADGDVTDTHGGSDVWVLRLNPNGDLLWEQTFGGSGNEAGFSVVQRADNDFILAGETNSFDGDVQGYHDGTDAWVIKFDKNGVLKEQICLGGSNNDFARSVTVGTDNSVLVGGTSSSFDGDVTSNHGASDAWVVKLSVPLGLKPETPHEVHTTLTITPNPASKALQISTNVEGYKKVEIFDGSGKLVQTATMEQLNKSLQINTLPAGAYLIRILTPTGHNLKASFVKA
jgi:hypothetical protein